MAASPAGSCSGGDSGQGSRQGQRLVHLDQSCPDHPLDVACLRVEFSTVHGAKGREADYVIVLDLNDGRWGFPSKVEDDPLLELVLPPVSGGAYPLAEERRLFYVAMTRARNGAHLVADPVQPSTFVTEMLKEPDELKRIGELAPECSSCRRGRLRPSLIPMYLMCSDSSCDHRAPRCPNCDAGYVLVGGRMVSCTNQDCRRRPPSVQVAAWASPYGSKIDGQKPTSIGLYSLRIREAGTCTE